MPKPITPYEIPQLLSYGDGLYCIETKWFVSGFVIKNHVITEYAPILRKSMSLWLKRAKRIRA